MHPAQRLSQKTIANALIVAINEQLDNLWASIVSHIVEEQGLL
jgi:hypothetical protein